MQILLFFFYMCLALPFMGGFFYVLIKQAQLAYFYNYQKNVLFFYTPKIMGLKLLNT
mgnify:CR=1 FL=1